MSGRVRLLLIVAVLIVLIGVGAAVLLGGRGAGTVTATPGAGTTVAQSTSRPDSSVTQAPAASPIPTVQIVVAIQPIGRGNLINPDMVDYREWPEEYAPRNALFNLDDVIGKIARTDIVREQPILAGMITENLSGLGAVGSDAAAVLPAGTRMISIPIDRLTTGAYAVQPGDRVDAIISLLFVDIDEEYQSILPNNVDIVAPDAETGTVTVITNLEGRPDVMAFGQLFLPILISPSEDPRPRLTTQMTIQDALVVYMGTFPADGRLFNIGAPTPAAEPATEPTVDPAANRREGTAVPTSVPLRPDVISLAVSPQDAVVVAYYVEAKIPVTFALRPANETGTVQTQPVTLEYVMRTYNIVVPTKLPYSIEPAIRSIRQLVNTEQLVFRPASDAVQDSGE
jgi:Flp pilus assembly protein CpaB